ncbi:PREDICTED: cinnamoyl-CoA reductase 1-like isoform X2 [Lupinus angustifolius]|uniref:cinnamoyl-CoA reductase 1-like isoform X2 n=1 Tax=Lupinus angustifolius TaxID=3871 RepID=UPI00092F8D8D|nr:PREDICTED: cinnamoyl-CoA reductase 1-like isoform X2 [Lupinus angustifolius]
MSSNTGEGKVVCVSGGSGYIASWIVKFLLQRRYTVRATVRDPSNPKKVEHLLELDGANERLQLFKADLLEEGSFDSVVQGCDAVFHTASPVIFTVNDPQWQPYILSKTLAENAAWKFVKENNIDMVTIHPALVIGPLLQPELNATSELVLNLINGTKTFPNTSFGWINVEDVANAHIQAYEIPSASGRYCLSERVLHYSDIVKILKNQYPTLPIADRCEDDESYEPTYEISKEKTKSLGIEFIPFEVSLRDIVESLKEKKFVNF